MAKSKTPKKKAPKKAVSIEASVMERAREISAPLPPPPPAFSVRDAAQEALDRLGASSPSVESGGGIIYWVTEGNYQVIESNLAQIIEHR
jgi:hypothetical protein